MAGLTDNGFEVKTVEEIVESMNEDYKLKFGENFDVNRDVIGQHSAQTSSELALAWEAIGGIYAMLDPDTNSGVMQDFTASLIGTNRLSGQPATLPKVLIKGTDGASASTTNLIVSYNSEQYAPSSPLIIDSNDSYWWKIAVTGSTTVTNIIFTSTNSSQDITVGLLLSDTEEEIADKVVNSFNAAQTIGLKDVFFAEKVLEGSTWTIGIRLLLEDANAEVVTETTSGPFTFEEYGTVSRMISILESAITVPLLTTLQIDLPPSNITGAFNIDAGQAGRKTETAAELRVRRKNSFSISGGGSLAAIIGRVGDVTGVTNVSGLQNVTKVTDSNGLPASSYQIIVSGTATDLDIGEAILDAGPAGIETHGDESIIITDESGNPVPVYFSRTEIAYISVKVVYTLFDEGTTSDVVVDEIKNAILLAAEKRSGGGIDLLPDVYSGTVMANVEGLESATVTFNVSDVIETNPVFTSGRQVITNLQIPEFNADRIQVTL